MKVRFTGEFEIEEMPDDRGSIDIWLVSALAECAKMDADDAFEELKLSWKLINPRGRPKKVKNDQNSEV